MARNDRQVAFRLPNELVDLIDDYAANLSGRTPGMNITRADVVRMFLVRGLQTGDEPTATHQSPPAANDLYDSFETYRPWAGDTTLSVVEED
jgi:hypothetical protein